MQKKSSNICIAINLLNTGAHTGPQIFVIGMEMYSINSGQKASKEHIGETGGEFEVRSEIEQLGLKKGDKIFIRQFDRVNKYNYKQYFNK